MTDPGIDEPSPNLAPGQYYTLVVVSMVSSLLSLAGSSAVAMAARRDVTNIYQRLVLGLSLTDALGSLMNVFHPFLLPRHVRDDGMLWASGNTATCSKAGFFIVLCPTLVSFYNLFLASYFYLKVRHNTPDSKIVKFYERPAICIAICLCGGLAITGSATQAFAPRIYHNICYFGDCEMGQPVDTCIYESGFSWYLGWLQVGLIVLPALAAVCFTVGVYRSVRHKLQASQRFVFGHNEMDEQAKQQSLQQDKKLMAVRSQSILYAAAYWNSFIWFFLYGVLGGDDRVMIEQQGDPFYFGLSLLVWTFFPLQGMINFLVYTRPRYLQWRDRHPAAGRWFALRRCLSFAPVRATAHVGSSAQSSAKTVNRQQSSLLSSPRQKNEDTSNNDSTSNQPMSNRPIATMTPEENPSGKAFS